MVAKNNTSGHTGVSYYPRNNKWRVVFRNKFYGYKDTVEEAIAQYKFIVQSAPPKKKAGRPTKDQRVYASMHAEHQVLRAKYRKLLSTSVSLSLEARYAFNEEYEAIRRKYYPKVPHAPKDLSSWEARRVAYEDIKCQEPPHEIKHANSVPPLAEQIDPIFGTYQGLSAKGRVSYLRTQYRKMLKDPALTDERRKYLRRLLSYHMADVLRPQF